MASEKLSLSSLILPQYVAGNLLPDSVRSYLDILEVVEMQTLYDDVNVVYVGKGTFNTSSTVTHNSSNGNFSWDKTNIHFRFMIPRDGAAFIDQLVNDPANTGGNFPAVRTLLNDLRPVEELVAGSLVATEYPAVSYRLELLVDVLNFTLGSEWKPGTIDPSNNRVILDSTATDPRVHISLPKAVISFSQGDDDNNLDPRFAIESWGVQGFDAISDLGMAELVNMTPAIALHESGNVAFSIDEVAIDVSKENTPPQIMEHFGIDEEWTGIFIKQFLLYITNDQGLGFNFQVKDALIGFDGKVSFEASLDLYVDIALTVFSVTPRFYEGPRLNTNFTRGILAGTVTTPPSTDPAGRITLRRGGELHLQITGGTPPYAVQVLSNGSNIWNSGQNKAVFNTAGEFNVFIHVEDGLSSGTRKYSEYIRVRVTEPDSAAPPSGTSADNPQTNFGTLSFSRTGNDPTHDLAHREENHQSILNVTGQGTYTLEVRDGTNVVLSATSSPAALNVPNGANYAITLTFPAAATPAPIERDVHFVIDKPYTATQENTYVDGLDADPATNDSSGDITFDAEMQALISALPDPATIHHIEIDGYASYDHASAAHDQVLSDRRVSVVRRRLGRSINPALITDTAGHGHFSESGVQFSQYDSEKRKATVRIHLQALPAVTITGTLSRTTPPTPTPGGGGTTTTPALGAAPTPPAQPNNIPPAIKQLGVRVKYDFDTLSLLEFYGKIDFETELEQKIRTQGTGSVPGGSTLDLTNDGLVDFKLGYIYDKAAGETTLTLALKSDASDRDGLLHMDNNANRDDVLKNIFGALLLFAPIINSVATAAASDSTNAGKWVALGASIAVPVAIGALNVFRTRRVILFGGEIRTKFVTPQPGEPLRSFDIGIVFDYEVQFDIIVESLGIGRDRLPGGTTPLPAPLRARYKAIGFNINYHDDGTTKGLQYVPVFDSSRGYDLDLSDPSLFSLPAPLGNLFNIAAARLARFNPVTLEIDFVIKVDLGIITVDRFKLKIPLDPVGFPQILPSGVRVNIPGVLLGNGWVEIIDKDYPQDDGSVLHAKGIAGGLDLTLVSLKLRICANASILSIKDLASQREAIAVFLSLVAQFPTPIILGQSGMGLFGLSGLFAMHFRRIEAVPPPGSAVGPALQWLINAGGEPTNLKSPSTGADLWGPSFDKWAFGIGVILGTVDGVLLNFQGMLILELPGPRILIMIKMRIVSALPEISDTAELTVGILGVIDIDFNLMQITLGVLVSFEIPSLLRVALPIEIFFKLDNPSNWHLYVGTIPQPASAEILGIVRGSAYFMVDGKEIDYGAPHNRSRVPEFLRNKKLNAIAIATGLEASVVLGDEGIGIYVRLAAGAHIGVSFSPFLAVGVLYFTGQLRLVIVSIGAHGQFNALISQDNVTKDYKAYIEGEICGSVDFFFFEISACVGFSIGDPAYTIEPPELVRGIYLQSFSPVLVSGQATSRPVDASLGNAKRTTEAGTMLSVPIDTIPVIQLQASPEIDGNFGTTSSIITPGQSEDFRPGGWIVLSDAVKVRYILKSVILRENGTPYSGPKIDRVWRFDKPKGGADTSIDLALFNRTPTSAEYAIERSTDLYKNVEVRWKDACKKAAPPASVLYTFCNQPLGPSDGGWWLQGDAKPDPPGTLRGAPVNTRMHVYQPAPAFNVSLAGIMYEETGGFRIVPAQIVGDVATGDQARNNVDRKCFNLQKKPIKDQTNPLKVEDELLIYSSKKVTSFIDRNVLNVFTDAKKFKAEVLNNFVKIKNTLLDVLPTDRVLDLTGFEWSGHLMIEVLKGSAVGVSIYVAAQSEITSSVVAQAYNSKKQLVDTKTITGDRRVAGLLRRFVITLTGEDIKYVVIKTEKFKGLILQVCVERKRKRPTPCHRALQIPYRLATETAQELKAIKDKLEEYAKSRRLNDYVIFETGSCAEVNFFAAVYNKFRDKIVVRELDAKNKTIKEYVLNVDIATTGIASYSQLPATWRNASMPWVGRVQQVSEFMFSPRFASYEKIMFIIKPSSPKCVKIAIWANLQDTTIPPFYVGITELVQNDEINNQAEFEGSIQTATDTLNGYLTSTSDRQLLKPNTHYIIDIRYGTEVLKDGSTTVLPDKTQSYEFRTDNAPPPSVEPYVLGTNPFMDDQYHFFTDPLRVVFNDGAFLKMYSEYGKSFKAVIRGADGNPVANSPDTTLDTTTMPAEILSPYREAIQRMIDAGLLPCMGTHTLPTHIAYTSPFELKPLMPYTFDLEFTVAPPVPAGTPSVTPLFRRAFKTSRFANLQDFAKNVSTASVRHKALTNVITLPASADAAVPVTVSDVEMENALTAAGFTLKEAAEESSCYILWKKQGSDFVPYAILFNTSEPVWRYREEYVPKVVRNEANEVIDPSFVIYEKTTVESLKLRRKLGQTYIRYFIKTQGGTRVIAMLDTIPATGAGVTCHIEIVQTASSQLGLSEKVETLLSVILSPKAPWEE